MPINSFLKKGSVLYKKLKSEGQPVEWPITRKIYDTYFPGPSEVSEKSKKSKNKKPKKSKKSKNQNKKLKLYSKAKKTGFTNKYVGTTIEELEDFLKQNLVKLKKESDKQFLDRFNLWLTQTSPSFNIPIDKYHLLKNILLLATNISADGKYLINNEHKNGKTTLTLSPSLINKIGKHNFDEINKLLLEDLTDHKGYYSNGEYTTYGFYFMLGGNLSISRHVVSEESQQNKSFNKIKQRNISKDGYFPYKINISKFRDDVPSILKHKILTTYDRYVNPNQDNECFGYSLNLKFPHLYSVFKSLRLFSNGTSLALKHYPLVASTLGICIKKRYMVGVSAKQQIKYKTYGNPSHPILEIISHKDHCFLDEKTDIHLSDIKRAFITSIKKVNMLADNLNSHKFISTLEKMGLLSPMSSVDMLKQNTTKVFSSYENDEDNPSKFQEFIIHGDDPNLLNGADAENNKDVNMYSFITNMYDDDAVVFFDFETFKDKESTKSVKYHNPYLAVASTQKEDKTYSFFGEDSGQSFLTWLKKYYSIWNKETAKYDQISVPYVIIHNAGYDFSFLIGIQGLIIKNRIGNSTRNTKRAECVYRGFRFIVQDSYAYIAMKLEKFNEDLQLGQNFKKGIFPYDAVTKRRLDKNSCSIEKALTFIKEEDKPEFLNQIKPHLIYTDSGELRKTLPKKFRITSLAEEYCIQDVNILKKGFMKFRLQISEITSKVNQDTHEGSLDLLDAISLPGISLNLLLSKGLLNNVYPLTGVCRQFVQQTIVGGRCTTFNNDKWDIQEDADNWDIKSLYPSTYSSLEIPQGLPTIINRDDNHYSNTIMLDNIFRWYFLEVNIIAIRKPRYIASLSNKNKDGVREWNDKPGTYFLNSIQLQDLCNFQEVTYSIIGGFGFSINLPFIKWNDFVDSIYKHKEDYAEEGNESMSSIIKLLLNSIYGKLTQNAITDKEKIFIDIENEETYVKDGIIQLSSKERFETYISKNFDDIELITYFNGHNNIKCANVKIKCAVYNHIAYNHIASYILAYSKRVMNKAIYICEDNNIPVFYTDTDSMYMSTKDRKRFIEKYTIKYGESPIQDKLGFFSSDLSKAIPKLKKNQKAINLIIIKMLMIGKKLYSDVIKYDIIDKETKSIIEKDVIYYNTKIKGIPHDVINYTTALYDYDNSYELIKKISDGVSITFDLTCGSSKACFACDKDFKFKTLNDFSRTIKI